jgi:molybdopterin synthase catalytic subunit
MLEPPFGPAWTALSAVPLDLAVVGEFLQDERAGGTCVFVGTTRRWTGEKETTSLAYEAYEPMAEAELDRLVAHARERWDVVRIAVLHRTGEVPPTQPSVVVGVACPHRVEAFEAARWLIDTLKTDVPIWKTDHAPLDSSL